MVRWTGTRPIDEINETIASGGISWPNVDLPWATAAALGVLTTAA